MRTAAVLIVGDEVLSGEVRDENGPFLVGRLAAAGVRVTRVAACGDREDDVVAELLRLRALADAVVVTGGIGPTHDDVTRAAVARALGLGLERHAEAVGRIRGFYGADATASDLEMALLPRGSRLLVGPSTGTYGFVAAGVYVLPGVPFLVRDLVEVLVPDFAGSPLHRVELRTDLREGELAPCLRSMQAAAPDVAIGSYPIVEQGAWIVRVVLRCPDPTRLREVESRLRADLAALAAKP
jgi:molybdenum cofactor synthesis domain-containing protein